MAYNKVPLFRFSISEEEIITSSVVLILKRLAHSNHFYFYF